MWMDARGVGVLNCCRPKGPGQGGMGQQEEGEGYGQVGQALVVVRRRAQEAN